MESELKLSSVTSPSKLPLTQLHTSTANPPSDHHHQPSDLINDHLVTLSRNDSETAAADPEHGSVAGGDRVLDGENGTGENVVVKDVSYQSRSDALIDDGSGGGDGGRMADGETTKIDDDCTVERGNADVGAENNGGEDGDRTVERETIFKKARTVLLCLRDKVLAKIGSGCTVDRGNTKVNAENSGGEDGDRAVEGENAKINVDSNGGKDVDGDGTVDRENDKIDGVGEVQLEGKENSEQNGVEGLEIIDRFADNNGGVEKLEIESVSKDEDNEKELSQRFHTEIGADNNGGEDGYCRVEEENDYENGVEKQEIEDVRKDEDSEKELSRRRSITRFPVRPEAEDCSFYVRTGTCKFGMNCKFNHPPNHKKFQGVKVKAKEECSDSATQKAKGKDESVDKEQIDCKYFDRPGGCKFGKACKFNHSKKTNLPLKLNFMGLPIRLGEKECPFYMRNGSCKFGENCRFNHPDPTSSGGPDASPRYSNGGSIFSPNASQSTRAPWSSITVNENPPYAPLMFPTQGVPIQSEWNAYPAPIYPRERNIPIPPTYAMNSQLLERPEQTTRDEFPERPGQPECSYFLRTGDCKYRSACIFHHPKSAIAQSPSCVLSDLGLPLRPAENVCSFYSRYGICKFGPACKYDHPINHAHSSELTVSQQ